MDTCLIFRPEDYVWVTMVDGSPLPINGRAVFDSIVDAINWLNKQGLYIEYHDINMHLVMPIDVSTNPVWTIMH